MMTLEFLGRIHKELPLTGSAIYESVIAIAERVNRKVHILRLHGQASSLLRQIETAHGSLGRKLATALSGKHSGGQGLKEPLETLDQILTQASNRVRRLKQDLLDVDARIRELKMETIHEDLLAFQRDLSLRSAAIERLPVVAGAPAVGKTLGELPLPPSVRVVTLFRGPFLVPPAGDIQLRPDDMLVLMGLRSDLDTLLPSFAPARSKKTA